MNDSDGRLGALAASPLKALRGLWQLAGLSEAALEFAQLSGQEPALASSFALGTAAQASLTAAALAAAELRHRRGHSRQIVSVDMAHAVAECSGQFTLNGISPNIWDKLSGLYPCGAHGSHDWVRIHANFRHHRDGALRLLGLSTGETTSRDDVTRALAAWSGEAFESAASEIGLVVAALRTFDQWDAHPQGQAVAALPLFTIERVGEAPPGELRPLPVDAQPLDGIRVLDLTRILAGPVAGRTLAAYGADVMLVNSPDLPNIEAIADTSRGKLSCHIDLRSDAGKSSLRSLAESSHVFVQGYRPGGLSALGFGVTELAQLRPGIVYATLSAYGRSGPWADKRGFDSLVQTASGFNHAEAEAAQAATPRALPVQILDYASGFLLAFAIEAALLRQLSEGGSWHVEVSLAQTGRWLRSLGRLSAGFLDVPRPTPEFETSDSGFGRLVAVRHAARFTATPGFWSRVSNPPGTDPARWP